MRKLLKNFGYLLAGLSIIVTASIYGQEDNLQKAKELEETEAILDEKISVYNEMLANYSNLQDESIIYSPDKTIFTVGDGYIELESYNFIREELQSTKIVGGQQKFMRLYFSGESLTKIETEIIEKNFAAKSTYYTKIVDPDPTSAENNDIEITVKVDDDPSRTTTLEQMQNTLTNPNRIKFKREFYITNLQDFERLFRYTEKYRAHYSSNDDYNAIEIMKRSLKY